MDDGKKPESNMLFALLLMAAVVWWVGMSVLAFVFYG